MTEAIRLFYEKVFAETDILRIFAEPFAYNVGSRRALEKAGFQLEGIMKCNAVKNGQVLDMALYSLTRQTEDYLVRRLNADEIQEKCCVDILRNKGESLCQGEQTRNLSCTDLRRLCWNEQMMTTRLRCRRLCRR